MKNYHIILKEDGLYLADLPANPDLQKDFGSDYETWVKYEQAKEQAIKDAVRLKDQELSKRLLQDSSKIAFVIRKDNPYKVDLSGYDVTRGKECNDVLIGNRKSHEVCQRQDSCCLFMVNVAILTPKIKSVARKPKTS